MAEIITRLKRKRGTIRTSVTKVIKSIESELGQTKIDTDNLEEFLEHLSELSDELKNIDNKLEEIIDSADLDAEFKSVSEYRESIITWKFRARKKITQLNKNNSTETFNVKEQKARDGMSEITSVKLPKLSINHFYGDVSQWLTFWNSFETSIHKNESLDKVTKFNYLKSYLKGSALNSVEGFAITSENYDIAIKCLLDRYNKKNLLINTHMNNLLQIHPLKSMKDVKSFRRFFDRIQTEIRSLESLNVMSDTYGNLLSPVLLKKIPPDMILEFNKQTENEDYDIKKLISFLSKQLNAMERSLLNYPCERNENEWRRDFAFPPGRRSFSDEKTKQNKRLTTAADLCSTAIREKICLPCVFCDLSSHDSVDCKVAQTLPLEKRSDILFKRGYCYRCLKPGHLRKFCRSKVVCAKCGFKHATLMCNKKEIQAKEKENVTLKSETESNVLSNQTKSSEVYLQTLIVCVRGNGTEGYLRCVYDSGSENCYVSNYAAELLQLEKVGSERIKHGLFGGLEVSENHNRYKLNLGSLDDQFSCEIEALNEKKICSYIPKVKNERLIEELKNKGIYLSDVKKKGIKCLFQENPEEIHLLLGADIAGALFTGRIERLAQGKVTAVETKLGWTLLGKMTYGNSNIEKSVSALSLTLLVSDTKLSDLWRLDILGISNQEEDKNVLEEETKKHFLDTVRRDETGRYEVSLPWIVDSSVLPNNRGMAEKSLYKTESKLINTNKRVEYQEIFDSWESNNIIEVVSDEKEQGVHYLPHRPVFKETSETTKIRPVFNASWHSKNSPSLNDCLAKGPNLIEIIPSILNRFRKYRVGVSSDIEKAFLQIKIREKDRDVLRFLWSDGKDNLKVYRHKRVVFGLTSSPFLLAATLNHLLNEVPEKLSKTAQILRDSFYVDNVLTSLNSIEETEKFIQEARIIMSSGRFNLRCWQSNLPNTMIDETEDKSEVVPVLGLLWNLNRDSLTCKVEEMDNLREPFTKRKILSMTQRIFDPIGFTSPLTLTPKLILQESWGRKLKWDEELPDNLDKQFRSWLKQLHLLPQIEIPRWLHISRKKGQKMTLHVFSDASKRAYATCAFLRIETSSGAKVRLVSAKNRVAPIKELTIPRLELLSCLIGARLAKTIRVDLQLEIPTIFWSDSSTALAWIRRDQAWDTFLHNRVQEIRSLTNSFEWRHVPGILNPADLPSRGCSFEQLQKSKWWEGPPWLYLPETTWPQMEEQPDEELLNKEKRKTIMSLLDNEKKSDWYYRYFSSYKKIVRMISWILRFYHNMRDIDKNHSPDLSVFEIERAEKTLYWLTQKDSFAGITDQSIRALRPIVDERGILRAKTSIVQRKDKEEFRYPVILPSNHPVVLRLIYEKHIELNHAGVTILMAQLRETLWILKSRKTIRNVLRKCTRCRRFEVSTIDVEPGIPPEDRIRDACAFEVVGIDLAGPLYLSDDTKSWIVLFTCAIYRAIHLELVNSLSTESFIQSFRRFIARRGRPYVVYSDNGSNFIGTDRALSNIDWSTVSTVATTQKIKWKFNPPSAAWWGGWWERLVRVVKQILRRVLYRTLLNYEELSTILCDCENTINSRPITYVSEDNKDPAPLTPLMFLQELPTSGVPDIDMVDSKALSRRAQYIQRLRNELRKRFRSEYLGQLRRPASKKQRDKQLKLGDVVLLEDINKQRLHWPLAKIIELLPGKDKVVRLARIKTESGVFLRPVQRLCPLEIP